MQRNWIGVNVEEGWMLLHHNCLGKISMLYLHVNCILVRVLCTWSIDSFMKPGEINSVEVVREERFMQLC
ncbi:hypothetical protein P8452_69253 [Trifolium repens]|nr:hypothetical protein P8452_69253 [Trifolium repens]